jgi:hypothetical protein
MSSFLHKRATRDGPSLCAVSRRGSQGFHFAGNAELKWNDHTIADVVICQKAAIHDRLFYRLEAGNHLPPVQILNKDSCFLACATITVYSESNVIIHLGGEGECFQPISLIPGVHDLIVAECSPFELLSVDPVGCQTCLEIASIPNFSAIPPLRNDIDIESLRAKFLEDSYLIIDDFLQDAIDMSVVHFADDIVANHHWLEFAKDNRLSFWLSDAATAFFSSITGLPKLRPSGELPYWRRFGPGSYVILNECYPEKDGLDLIYFSTMSPSPDDNSGRWLYLDDNGQELLTFSPKPNRLVLVYRSSEVRVSRFRHYVSRQVASAQVVEFNYKYDVVV